MDEKEKLNAPEQFVVKVSNEVVKCHSHTSPPVLDGMKSKSDVQYFDKSSTIPNNDKSSSNSFKFQEMTPMPSFGKKVDQFYFTDFSTSLVRSASTNVAISSGEKNRFNNLQKSGGTCLSELDQIDTYSISANKSNHRRAKSSDTTSKDSIFKNVINSIRNKSKLDRQGSNGSDPFVSLFSPSSNF